jgi:hypothetical protein
MVALGAAVLLALAQAAPAPSPAVPPAAVASDVPTRTISFWAAGDKGEAVEGLTTDEVVVMEDGAARVVTKVVRDPRPLTLSILVDSSAPLASTYRLNVVDAVAAFVRDLPPGTRYALWTTGDRPKKIVDFTDDRTRAASALRKAVPSGGNTLLDALVEASEELEKSEAERTVLLAITGVGIGFTNNSRQQVVDTVRKSRVQVMAVQYEETGSEEFQAAGADQVTRADYDYVLGNLAAGGVIERPLSAMGLGGSLRKVAAALSGYRATYALDDAGRKAGKVEVQIARPGVKARVVGGETR